MNDTSLAIDHKAEAERLTADNSPVHAHEMGGLATQLQALVHATLYAAEQQQIANLIAYANNWNRDSKTNEGQYVHDAIRQGLGL